jgi:hypothetical protein
MMSQRTRAKAEKEKQTSRAHKHESSENVQHDGSASQADMPALQRAAGNQAVDHLLNTDANQIPPIVKDAVNNSNGRALDPMTREMMESVFDQDFSRVRVHTDPIAAASAQTINALAYTVGSDIVFAPNQFAPNSANGQQLLAHELTHVVQQSQAGAPIQVSLQAASGKSFVPIGNGEEFDTKSLTQPPYTAEAVKRRLAQFNQGTITGKSIVDGLNKDGWSVVFFTQPGHNALTDSTYKRILLPGEWDLTKNAETLFHEGIHAIHHVEGAAHSQSAWVNLEDEVNAQYQEILFLQANAKKSPQLVKSSEFADDWQQIQSMDQEKLFDYFKETLVPEIILGKMMSKNQYADLLAEFGNDVSQIAESRQVDDMLNRVIYKFYKGNL